MKKSNLNRRDFNKLTAAALGGMVAGTLAGCAGDTGGDPPPTDATSAEDSLNETLPEDGEETPADEGEKVALHACRGLNACKGKGAGGDNACAGQGICATTKHECAGNNACKGLGGCGANAGANECKGKGGCHVPMKPDGEAWKAARAAFEKAMAAQEKAFGDAPAAPAKSEGEEKPKEEAKEEATS